MTGETIQNTIDQLIIQAQFVRRIGMPMKVYSFTGGPVARSMDFVDFSKNNYYSFFMFSLIHLTHFSKESKICSSGIKSGIISIRSIIYLG